MSKFYDLPNGDMINLKIVASVIYGQSRAGGTACYLAPRVLMDIFPERDDMRGVYAGRIHIIECETDDAALALRETIKAAVRAQEAETE